MSNPLLNSALKEADKAGKEEGKKIHIEAALNKDRVGTASISFTPNEHIEIKAEAEFQEDKKPEFEVSVKISK